MPRIRLLQDKITITAVVFVLLLSACKSGKQYRDEIYTKPAIVADPVLKSLTPEEALKTLYLPKGFKIELVASEPLIGEPVSITWDGNGRMYVAQMNTYMQDADAINENMPWSRITILDDTDGDGRMDKSSVFMDSLVLPRIVLPLDDRVIVGETYQRNLYSYRDRNGDGRADEKVLLLEDTVRDNRNLEHQDASMLWNIDNWLYVTNKAFRYRFTNNTLIRDTMREPLFGQWGVTQDETGRIFLSRAGAEVPALAFQQHPVYGALEMKGKWDSTFDEPWPLVGTPDAQGGLKRIRKENNTLNRFTGVAGQEIYLGDQMPNAYGDLFIPEPVGRLVRRAKVEHRDGKIVLRNPYHQAEFLASTDPLFRPVYATTGPDGCLYIVDMYRGIIQEGNWTKKGSYLREVVDRKGYDKFVQKGRIYRIYHEDMKPENTKPQLIHKSAKELIPYLSHKNGWWRMTAQKLIVLKGDQSVVDDLKDIVEDNEGFFAGLFGSDKDYGLERLHALWTLEGMGSVDEALVKKALKDEDRRVRVAAIRMGERYLKQNNTGIFAALKGMSKDKDPEVIQQLLLTLRVKNNETKPLVQEIVNRFPDNELIETTAKGNLDPGFSEVENIVKKYKGSGDVQQMLAGFRIYKDNCAACHGESGKGSPQLAPPLVGSPRVNGDMNYIVKVLLHGLTGPLDGKEYNGPMAAQAAYSDAELANVISYVRGYLNEAGMVNRDQVKKLREKYKDRKGYWTTEELAKAKK